MEQEYKSKLNKYEVVPNDRPSVFSDKGKLLYAYELILDLRYILCKDMKNSDIAKEIAKHSDLTQDEVHESINSIITQGYFTLGADDIDE